MTKMKKLTALVLSAVLLVTATVAVTLAYLTDETEDVVNIFTVGHVDIDLAESEELDLQMIPGRKIAKDPIVTVEEGSENCWLFIEITMSDNYSTYLEDYVVSDDWTKLEDGVYYIEDAEAGDEFYVLAGEGDGDLANGFVTIKTTVVEDDMTDAETTPPTLTFKAYAVQDENVTTATEAWAIAKPAI